VTVRLRIVAVGCAAVVAALASASSAAAGEAVLWACHGPAGQPLGVQPLVAASFGDGVISTYGSGCGAPVVAIADGGLRAAFTRPDPSAGSQAFWRFDVPAGLTLEAVQLRRRTRGFGGVPVPGGGASYATETSAGALESASVEDATNVALDGVLDRDPASGLYVRFGVQCTTTPPTRCAAPGADPLGADVSAIALRVGDADAPRGAVGGVSSPAAGTLTLSLFGNDAGLGLASTHATLDGTTVAVADLGGASCAELSAQDATIDLPAGGACPGSVSGVPLAIDTTRVPDGPHQLRVLLRDAAGNEVTVADEQIMVRNTAVQTSNEAVLTLGSGAIGAGGVGGVVPPGAGPGAGGGAGAGAGGGTSGGASAGPACLKPRLSMMLRSKPLRTFRGIPVLDKRIAYRYTGHLTCQVSGRRVAARTGTVVEILSLVGRHITGDGGTTVRRGFVSVLLRYGFSRIVRFRHRSVDKSVARVSIRIAVAHPLVVRR
jgi:hypothetical protein